MKPRNRDRDRSDVARVDRFLGILLYLFFEFVEKFKKVKSL